MRKDTRPRCRGLPGREGQVSGQHTLQTEADVFVKGQLFFRAGGHITGDLIQNAPDALGKELVVIDGL